jgi:hypothetical protein
LRWGSTDYNTGEDFVKIVRCYYCKGKRTINIQSATLILQNKLLTLATDAAKRGDINTIASLFKEASRIVPIPRNRRSKIIKLYSDLVSSDKFQDQLRTEDNHGYQSESGQV